ncbi:MAG: DUF805 domain-containing protein [Methylocella sp.]
MDFQTAIKTCFNKYAIFKGRSSRSEYWFFLLGIVIVSLATGIIDAALFGSSKKVLNAIWNLMIVLPLLAVIVRRLHDLGRSGWLLLIYHITLVLLAILASMSDNNVAAAIAAIGVAGLVFVIYFLSLPGDQGPNQYGEDPLVSASQDAGRVNYPGPKTREQNLSPTDNLALLERFYDLRQKGILTDAEFEWEKKRILGG